MERVITDELVNLAQTCFVEVTLIDLIAVATVLTASGGPFCGPNTARCCRLSSLSPGLRHRHSTAFVAKNVLDLATSRSPIMSEKQNQSPSASARVSIVSCRVASCLLAGTDDALDYTVISLRASVSCLVVTLLIVCVVPIWIYLHRFLELLVCNMHYYCCTVPRNCACSRSRRLFCETTTYNLNALLYGFQI